MTLEFVTKLRSEVGYRAFFTVLLVAAVGIATIGLPIIYGGTTAEAAEPAIVESYETISQAEADLGPADDLYLREDGSAVLHYEDHSDFDQFDLGMDVSKGLAHVLIVDEVGEPDEEFEEMSVSAMLEQDELSGEGSFVMNQPDEIEDLTVAASGEVTDETNQFEASATGTFESQNSMDEAVATNGHVTVTADRFETSGTAAIDSTMDASTEVESLDVSLEETEAGYAVDVNQERSVSDWSKDRWETRERAEQALQEDYGDLAEDLGGTSDIQLTHYEFEERETGDHRLELEFTVEYTGIDDGAEQALTDELADDQSLDLTQDEAETIATSVTALEIETFEFAMTERSDSIDLEWDIALANYTDVTLAMIDLVESRLGDDEVAQESIDDARTAIDAQQAADLEWELRWNADVEQLSTDTMQLDAEVESNTENWAAYVDELEANGIETPAEVSFDLTATTDGDELTMDAEFEVETEALAATAIDSWVESIQESRTVALDAGQTGEAEQVITALADSNLEIARVDASIDDDTVRIEAGAKVEDATEVANTVSETAAISGIATEGTTSMYIYVDDMEGIDTESATYSDVEHLAVVDAETTVHQAGEWDEEIPEVDTAGMSDYLDIDASDEAEATDDADKTGDTAEAEATDDVDEAATADENETAATADENETGADADSDSVPGFGVSVGLVAIAGLLTGLLLRRQA